ncbi:MAG: Cof-type HAD-IIB family hydrolase [Collinsella sp.]|nr:Cof-type HAD-IIB family hydrolase [Collinsella sp.]
MSIRAIALDIDGTLTNDAKQITPRTRRALMEAQASGIKLILASGRPPHGLRSLARELELDSHNGLLVAFNGSQVRDAMTGEVLYDQPISAETSRAVLEHVSKFDVIPMLVDGDRLYIEDAYRCTVMHNGEPKNIVKYERDACGLRIHEVSDLVQWCQVPQNKILTAGSDVYLKEHHRDMMAPFADSLSCMFTADFYFEFTDRGIDKGRALSFALPRCGIDASELVAFGDGQNDVAMIELAGVGVAMGNAVAELKDVADMVTASNNDDGIALALERLLG